MPDICALSTEQTASKRDIILNIWWTKTSHKSSTHCLNVKNKMKTTKARHVHVFKKTEHLHNIQRISSEDMAVKKLVTKSYLKKENWSSKKMTIYNSFKILFKSQEDTLNFYLKY